MNPQFWFFAHLSDHHVWSLCSAMRTMILWLVKNFLSLFITFRTKIRKISIPLPIFAFICSPLEWSLNASVDAVCIFVNLCSTLVCSSNVLQLGSIFLRNAQKKRKKSQPNRKKLNVDRPFLKDVIRIFDGTLCNLVAKRNSTSS